MATKRSPRRPTRRQESRSSGRPVTLTSLPAFRKSDSKSDHLINAIIETPRGSRCKFKYDPDHGVFELHRMLPAEDPYPYDFGFIPSTVAEDGDPIDVLVLLEATQFPGCVVPSRLIGVLEIEQREHGGEGKPVRNDRLIAVGAASQTYGSLREITDLPT